MAPKIDGPHNESIPVCHDLYYHIEDNTPILDAE